MGRWVLAFVGVLAMWIAGSSGYSILRRVDTTIERIGTANSHLMTANAKLGNANQQLAEMKSRLTEVNKQLVATNERLDHTQEQVALATAKIDKTNSGLAQTIAELGETKSALARTNGNLSVIDQFFQKFPLLRPSGSKPPAGGDAPARAPLAAEH
jgi:peptidoglycan hydrolase CwlO-like protein